MDIRIRRLILSVFFLLFFILAPILLIYASGYRYDFKRDRLLRTGNIFLEADSTANARIFLNGERYKNNLLKKIFIKNILPGEYTLRVEKDGFFSWQKKIQVHPGLTSFAKEISLFAQSNPTLLLEENILNLKISQDKKYAAYTVSADGFIELYLINIKNTNPELIYRVFEDDVYSFNWSQNSSHLVINDQDGLILIANTPPYTLLNLPNSIRLSTLSNQSFDDNIYYQSGGAIYSLAISSGLITKIFEAPQLLPQIYHRSGTVYYFQQNENSTELKAYILARQTSYQLAELPKDATYYVSEINNSYIIVSNYANNKSYLIKRSLDDSIINFSKDIVAVNGTSLKFSPDKSRILINSLYDLHIYDPASGKISLIDRTSSIIEDALWHTGGSHVMIARSDRVTISDLDLEQEIQRVDITINLEDLRGLSLLDNSTLIFAATYDGKRGIYLQAIK